MLKPRKETVKESVIEIYLRNEIKKIGGEAYKFTSPARRAVPDRLCILPKGLCIFVECKAPGKVPTPAQEREMKKLTDKYHSVFVVDSKESVDTLIQIIKNRLHPTYESHFNKPVTEEEVPDE